MIPKNRVPTHPGEILLEEFLKPSGMSQVELAQKLSVPVQRINTFTERGFIRRQETFFIPPVPGRVASGNGGERSIFG